MRLQYDKKVKRGVIVDLKGYIEKLVKDIEKDDFKICRFFIE